MLNTANTGDTKKLINDGALSYEVRVLRAQKSGVTVRLVSVEGGEYSSLNQRWSYGLNGLELKRCSVAWDDDTEIDCRPCPKLARKVRDIAFSAWMEALVAPMAEAA